MIKTVDEFITLRQSENIDEQYRASHDNADLNVWLEVIKNYPDLKTWVIHNKTIQIEILKILCADTDQNVRSAVARKRKINEFIFNVLSVDPDENVRYALMCNTNLTVDKIKTIKIDDLVPSEYRRLTIRCVVLAADSEVVHANRLYKPRKNEASKKNKTITYLYDASGNSVAKQRKQ